MRKGMAPPSPLPPRAAGLLGSPPRCVRVRRRCHRHHARPVFSVHPFLGSPASAFLPASNPRLLPTPQLHRRSRHHRRLHEPAGAEEHPLHRWTGGGGGEKILHAVFVPFRENKGVKGPLDQATQKHCSFGFFTFLERENTATSMDNMDGTEFFGRVLTVNYAFPEKIKGGEQGWAAQPVFVLSQGEKSATAAATCRGHVSVWTG
ncbi:peptidyl-prolyl cis-trans isomerase E-like [Triticum dicoccoides]|uniref:peptidyl-prolyl cis-trans isomerase E-like n=1 Tax=Triticum dicoccoides TaxID=85692 RepID=UPI00188FE527|nr:peptidyl-prolyl cis-trans isomerase E-like [Triticum dicoccoides]XP_044347320.1 peptidyl-prolyl cis-trans isomerase E-like [Triticum aestivum]